MKTVHAWSPIYVRIISNWGRESGRFFSGGGSDAPRQTMGDGGGRGRHKTDVMRDWEWKGRKRGNMIESEASAGFEAWMNGLCFSGTATGLNLRNSPKHLNREAEFLFLGGLRLLRIISKIGTFWDSLTSLLDWQSRRLFFENRCKKKFQTPNLTLAVIIKRNHRVKTGFVCVCTHAIEGVCGSMLSDCGCLSVTAGVIMLEWSTPSSQMGSQAWGCVLK